MRRRLFPPPMLPAIVLLLTIVLTACSSDSGSGGGSANGDGTSSATPTAPIEPPWTPTPRPSVPVIPGVSEACVAAMVEYSQAPLTQAVLRACPTLEELLLADSRLGMEGASAWESFARDTCTFDSTIPICADLPVPTAAPTALPETLVRSHCASARPKNLYSVTAAVATRTAPLRDQAVRVLLVEVRDLAGKVKPDPGLKDDTFYDFEPFIAGSRSSATPIEVDAIACIALRATELEHWYYEYNPSVLYPVYASNAIVWLADAKTGKAIGKPWLIRPPADTAQNHIYFGDGGTGQRAPNQEQILSSIEKFYGL